MHTIIPIVVLMFTYLALSANLQVSNIILGFIIAAGILGLLRPRRRPVRWRRLPSALKALVVYVGLLLYNVFRSGIQMVRIILHPKLPIKSGIVAIPSGCDSELGRAISAHAISLPPGELFVEMDEHGSMYIHSLDVDLTEKQAGAAQEIQGDMLKRIFD
jgi:multicomponent Na+:H+ antiporter subunit E